MLRTQFIVVGCTIAILSVVLAAGNAFTSRVESRIDARFDELSTQLDKVDRSKNAQYGILKREIEIAQKFGACKNG